MSEALKKLRKEEKQSERRERKFWSYEYRHAFPYEPLAGMSNIEQQAEEARRKEQQIKEELRLTKEEVERKLLRTVAQQIEDEEKGYLNYRWLAVQLNALGLGVTANEALKYAEDENRHKEGLMRLFSTIRGAPFKGKG